MNKTNQFIARTQYVTPSCKLVTVRARRMMLSGSGNMNGHGLYDINEDNVEDQTGDWGL